MKWKGLREISRFIKMEHTQLKIAVLDDYQQVSMQLADWSEVLRYGVVQVFSDHLSNENELVERLRPFDVLCVMRERTPLTRELLKKLPNLKLVVSTGKRNLSVDAGAMAELGIVLKTTGYVWSGAPEMTWALLMAMARHLVKENENMRENGWQQTLGVDLEGKTLGIMGLGNIGKKIAEYGRVFGMRVIAWSRNLTPEQAQAGGAEWVSKEELFRASDFLSLHLVLGAESRGIVGRRELELMKPGAYLINTSRGPLVEEEALIAALKEKRIRGAALDVFELEPLPAGHPFRLMDNVLVTPHIGYVTERTYRLFYEDTVKGILEWLKQSGRTGIPGGRHEGDRKEK